MTMQENFNFTYLIDVIPTNYYLFLISAKCFDEENVSQVIRGFIENIFTSKFTGFNLKGLENFPNKWLQVIKNNDDYVKVLYFLKKKHDKQNQK